MKTIQVFAFVLSVCGGAAAQTTYTITQQGAPNCVFAGINEYGGVAGQCNQVATAWINGVENVLGKLPNGTYSVAQSINSHGVAVGDGDIGDSRPLAELYRNGTVINIDPSAANAHALFINEAGAVAGNYLKGFGGCNNWSASIWVENPTKPGTFQRTDLQPYPGGDGKVRCEFATAANQGLQVVGSMQNSLFGQMGAFWNNDAKHTLSLLQPVAGDWNTIAWAINDLGQAAGVTNGPFSSRPVIWKNDSTHTPVGLALLPGDNYGVASGINNLGEVIGTSAYAVPGTWNVGPSRFVVWRDGGVFDLQSLLDPVTGAGWTITNVTAINNVGQIAGSGVHNGQSAAFVMTPAVP